MGRELILSLSKKDFVIQTFRSGGPGGQHQNKVESGVRIIHPDSGAVGESRNSRSQHANKKMAFLRLTKSKKFNDWIRMIASSINIEGLLNQRDLKVEVMKNGKWIEGSLL